MAALHQGVWGDQADEDTYDTVKLALDCGINFFDNAEMYGDGYAEEAFDDDTSSRMHHTMPGIMLSA